MYIHKKGYGIIFTVILLAVFAILLINWLCSPFLWLNLLLTAVFTGFVIWTVLFFRVPTKRIVTKEDNAVVSAADGTVVVIEETDENEYFHDKRIQVSVFMSAYDVHVNWFPMDGVVTYHRYHPGKKMFAINPKSSEFNERNTFVVKDDKGREVLFRQIAGVMARRIVWHAKVGTVAEVGKEFGMIRFGSRVDFFLPLDAEINVKLYDVVRGQMSVLAYLK